MSNKLDVVIYGATGYTGRLIAEHFLHRYGADSPLKWGMAGRSEARLIEVRDQIGAPKSTPLIVADASTPASIRSMCEQTRSVASTVGPYQLYGSPLVAACAEMGVDYLDLCGEPSWMHQMIHAHGQQAQASGARILFSCGFDSIPFELGVFFLQQTAKATLGAPTPRVKGRVRALRGGLSGGTAATGKATLQAMQADPAVAAVLMNPFSLTPDFQGPAQPSGAVPDTDPDVGPVVPFMMAMINTKNVHRSNYLLGHRYGRDFVYDEMAMSGGPAGPATFTDLGSMPGGGPTPGTGPTKAERDSGLYDLLFIGIAADGRKLRILVKGDKDPGYGSTSQIFAETAITLAGARDVPGGIWTPGAALQERLVRRLSDHAGLTFTVEKE